MPGDIFGDGDIILCLKILVIDTFSLALNYAKNSKKGFGTALACQSLTCLLNVFGAMSRNNASAIDIYSSL